MRTGSKGRNTGKPRFSKVVGDPHDARGMLAAMLRYIEHRGVLGATLPSLINTEGYIRDFIDWADSRSVTHPEHVTQAVLERYQRWLYHYRKKSGAPLSIASQRAKIVPLRGFFKWLTRTGQLPANPAAELELPKRMRRLPRHVLTVAEVETVLAQADTSNVLGLRDRAMMELLYSTGMRRMEIAGLTLGDVDIERQLVLIREGKGRKDRMVPVGERALHWLQQYLARGREQLVWNAQDTTLFLGKEGLPLSYMWLSAHIGHYIRKADLGKQGSCHLFRHTMATLMMEGGADIRFIQAILGHEKLETTQIYTHVALKQLQLVHSKTHPGAHLRLRGAAGQVEQVDGGERGPEQESAAEALFAALAQEADEENES